MQRGKHKGNNRKGKQDVPQGLPSEPARLAKDCVKTAVTASDDQSVRKAYKATHHCQANILSHNH